MPRETVAIAKTAQRSRAAARKFLNNAATLLDRERLKAEIDLVKVEEVHIACCVAEQDSAGS